jgi:hypothetical protein
MKTLLTAVLTLLLIQSAYGKDIASFRFATRDHAQDSTHSEITVFETVLTDTQEIKITTSTSLGRFPFFVGDGVETKEYTKLLNERIYKMLKQNVMRLSKAEIITREAQVVCMMMPGPTHSNNHLSVLTDYDYSEDNFMGKMKLVSGPQGCWVRKSTFPKNEYDRATAQELKALIKALVLDFVE